MKQKLKDTWRKISNWRKDNLFRTPKEYQALMMVYRNAVEQAFGIQRDRFKTACREFAAIRTLTRKKTIYRLEYEIDADLLSTSAGEKQAASAIAVEIAKQILERHTKHVIAECKHEGVDFVRNEYNCKFCGKIFTADERNKLIEMRNPGLMSKP